MGATLNAGRVQDPMPLSIHAAARIRQRGLKEDDLALIRQAGEAVADGFLMSNKAIDTRKRLLMREIECLERLRGVALIESTSCVVTIYRTDKKRTRRLRHGAINVRLD